MGSVERLLSGGRRVAARLLRTGPVGHSPWLVLGFAAMLLLMVFITAIGVARMAATQRHLEAIVHDNMTKIVLATRMHDNARERTISLQRMILYSDPFERDEEWMRFNHYGAEFAKARGELIGMVLTEDELSVLAQQGGLTGVAVPLQMQVVDLISAGRAGEAHDLLVKRAIPAQDQVLEKLAHLYALQERAAAAAAAAAAESYQRSREWMMLLSGAALVIGIVIAVTVVRRTRRTEKSLFREKERAQVTLHSIAEGVIRTDRAGQVEYLNPVAERLTGWTSAEAHARPLATVFPIMDDQGHRPVAGLLDQVLSAGEVVSGSSDLVLVTPDRQTYAIELTAAPIHDDAGAIMGVVLVFRDVTEMRALARELAHQASHDALTNLPNRRAFERHLQRALDSARADGRTHGLCYVDLDLFKVVNDSCGHIAGDELLKQLGAVLRTKMRKTDVLARLGGDEFGVLVEDCPLDQAERIAAEIHQGIRDFRFIWEGKTFDVGASIGLTELTADSGTIHDALRVADLACYAAKDQGRGRVYAARAGDTALAARAGEIGWVPRIKRALVEDRMVLYCQEIRPLSAAAGPARYEILVRLKDENGTIVAPMAFLPAAERYQLMPAIDRWVIGHALSQLDELGAAGPETAIHVSINLSGQSLCEPGFLAYILERLKRSSVPPERICFEVTETAAVANLSGAVQFITALKAIGCRFALDDFGSGLSSFAYLKNLPIDYLKIDGTFIRHIVHDRADRAMVSSIQQLASLMGIQTVAEYVENDEIRDVLESLSIDYAQGYAIALPCPLVALRDAAAQPSKRAAAQN